MKKTIFITWATDGIWKWVAMKLAHQWHYIYLHGRSDEKLQNTIQEIKEISGNVNIKWFIADFEDIDSVKNMVKTIRKKVIKIDILINNAWVYTTLKQTTKNGIDTRFVVNYLSQVVLTNLLLPLLNNSKRPRIINLSSAAQAPVDLNILQWLHQDDIQTTYAQSKLAFTMWSMNLAKTVKNISVIAVNPGSLLDTKMAHEAFGQSWSSAEKWIDILYQLAAQETIDLSRWIYFDNDSWEFSQAHPYAYDENKIQDLLDITQKILNK